MKLTLIVSVLIVLECVVAMKQFQIAVMVPGKESYKELVKNTQETTVESQEDINNDYESYYYGDYDLAYCTDNETGLVDFECRTIGLIDTTYKIYPWSYLFIKPALDIAAETIRDTYGHFNNFNILPKYYDCADKFGDASPRLTQIELFKAMISDEINVLIGPMSDYSMSPVAFITAHWDILTISPGSTSYNLRKPIDGEESKNTLVRMGPVAKQVGECVSSILKYYNWTRAPVEIFEDDIKERHYFFLAEGIYEVANEKLPGTVLNQIRLSEYRDENSAVFNYDTIQVLLKTQGRAVVLSAADFVVRDFIRETKEYGESGEYAYIILDLENKLGPKPWEWINDYGILETDESLKQAFENVLIVTLRNQKSLRYKQFTRKLQSKYGRDLGIDPEYEEMSKNVSQFILEDMRIKYGAKTVDDFFEKNKFPAYFHDSLLTLAHLLNTSLSDKETPLKDGIHTSECADEATKDDRYPSAEYLMKKYILNQEFEGVSGRIALDADGDRLFDFSILDLDPEKGEFQAVAEYDSFRQKYREFDSAKVHWINGAPPPDIPVCGFKGEKCKKGPLTMEAVIIAAISLATFAIVIYNTYRRHKLRKELESQLWRVHWTDITWPITPNSVLGGQLGGNMGMGGDVPTESEPSLGEVISYYVPSLSPAIAAKRAHKRKRKWSSNSRKNERVFENERKTSAGSLISDKVWGGLTTLATYKDKTVVVKLTNRKKVDLTRAVLMELKHMRDVTHEHLTRFEGACIDWPHISVLNEYCRKGSLRDILQNEELQLDWMFRVSLMNDLVKGMCFLHRSPIGCHGNLKSTNCVVDSRFVLKITDYGLHAFRSVPTFADSERQCEKKLWTAPELLRCSSNEAIGTKKGDVYSFGIILQEIALRKGTFYVGGTPLSCREIVSKVRYAFQPYFRPMVDNSVLSEDVCSLMQKCWHEDPAERPDFTDTRKIIERFNKDNPGNLVENLLHRMEQYAINLEGLVEERTAAYMEEKRKADDLLYQMLPVPVVDRLKRGDSVPAEAFESVTICFTDIVGFTALSASSNPMQVVSLLNDLYTCFDAIIDNFDVYKVETIGDAYMLVSGLPVRNGIRHAGEIARTALALLKAVSNFKIRHRPGDQLKLRIGIHTGPCCAGVVGLKMPRYCLFGDTVNTASRMESSGMPLAIHVSESTKQLLDRYQCFKLQPRGEVPMKGKGTLTTYWLLEEVLFEAQSLDESECQGLEEGSQCCESNDPSTPNDENFGEASFV
ncbi:unnamed protein product [Clavelina lepadiformis]|uniref:Guanylate cyclase n=1 Tax=Clavelina lepadiformis TaxID=159417 RepID=A0ABP0F6V3_CLALP